MAISRLTCAIEACREQALREVATTVFTSAHTLRFRSREVVEELSLLRLVFAEEASAEWWRSK